MDQSNQTDEVFGNARRQNRRQVQRNAQQNARNNNAKIEAEEAANTPKHPLESVPYFSRPMGSSTEDVQVGVDDQGNPLFKGQFGTYVVQRADDQRTTRTKIEQDVVPAVKEYLNNPTAPTKEQAVNFAKAVAGDAWETVSIPGDLLSGEKSGGDVTLGEVFSLAPAMGAASLPFEVPGGKDTLRIFGGARAKNPPNLRGYEGIEQSFEEEAGYDKVKNLNIDFEVNPSESLAAVKGEIYANPQNYDKTFQELQLGKWFSGRDGVLRFEIDDSKSTVKNIDLITPVDKYDMSAYNLDGFDFSSDEKFPSNSIPGYDDEKAFTTLEDVFDHKELYEQYPELRNAPVIEDLEYFEDNPNVSGYFAPDSGVISLNSNLLDTPEAVRSTLLHEIQHLIQRVEGFESGTNVKSDEVFEMRTYRNNTPEAKQARAEYEQRLADFNQALPNIYEQLAEKNTETARDILEVALEEYAKTTGIKPRKLLKAVANGENKWGKTRIPSDIRDLFVVAEGSAAKYRSAFVGTEVENVVEGAIEAKPSNRFGIPFLSDNKTPKYTDYLEGLSGEERLNTLADITNSSGRTIRRALEKYATIGGPFRDRWYEKFGTYPDLLRQQSHFPDYRGKNADRLADIYGLKVPRRPMEPLQYDNHLVYQLKRGETEARLVSARKDIPGKDRSPENVFDQEDKLPKFQWGMPEIKRIREEKKSSLNNPSKGSSTNLSASSSEAGTKATLEDFGYYVSNPSEEWAKRKQDYAEAFAENGGPAAQKLLTGPQTAFLGGGKDTPLYLDVDFVSKIRGANDEVTDASNLKYVDLKESVKKEGFLPDQKGNAIVIGINHKGQAFVMEGNNRVAVAKESGVPNIKAEIRYFNGGEDAGGEFSPENILQFASKEPRKFAQGGAVGDMNRQMELFAQGGLKDDGMNIDPVSGNDIPSGSLAEEVRDDIPAQLSDGEYVVPADVVRYYGVKFFEDLRTDAKMGLTDMEANGRIGGEPVDTMSSGSKDLTEEDLLQLDQMISTGAYNGGLMDKLEYVAKNDPAVNQRLNQGGVVVGFSQGGVAQQSLYSDPNQIDAVINKVMAAAQANPEILKQLSSRGIQVSRTNPQMQAGQMDQANPPAEARQAMNLGGLSSSITSGTEDLSSMATANYITTPTTINPAFNVPGGSYTYASGDLPEPPKPTCGEGYTFDEEKGICVPVETAPVKPQQSNSDDGSGPTFPTTDDDDEDTDSNWTKGLDFTDPGAMAKWGKGLSEPMKGNNIVKVGALMAGGPLGLAVGAGMAAKNLRDIAKLRASALVAEARGDTELAKTLTGYADERTAASSLGVRKAAETFATGTQMAESIAKGLGYESFEQAETDRFGRMTSSKDSPKPEGGGGNNGGGNGGGTTQLTAQEMADATERARPQTDNRSSNSSGSLSRTTLQANRDSLKNKGTSKEGQVSAKVDKAGTAQQTVSGGSKAEQDYVTSAAAGARGGLMSKRALNKKAQNKN